MRDQYGLLRFDDDHSLLPLLAVKTSVVGLECKEFFAGYVKAFRLHLFDVAVVGERGNDGFDFGRRDLQKQGISASLSDRMTRQNLH